MAAIVHFNIPADDSGRAKKFYTGLFEWKFTELPGPMNYHLIETADLNGKPGIGGGLAKREEPGGIINYIGVASMDASMSKVTELGGQVLTPKMDVPGWGVMALCRDTEGNTFGLFQETT